jgi:predicted phosphoribosyltransferase
MYFNSEKETKKNMKRIVTLLLMTTLCLTMTAQGKLTLQARMQMMRQKAQMERNENAAHAKKQPATAQEQQRMTLVVSVADSNLAATVKQMKAAGAEVRSRLGRQVVINIPIDSVDVLQSIEGVQRIDKGHKGYKKSDVQITNITT